MHKKINPAVAAGMIGAAVVMFGIAGYMMFVRGSNQPEKLTAGQQVQERVMRMSPEERRKFGEDYAARMGANSGAQK
jgi:hypothetical protein